VRSHLGGGFVIRGGEMLSDGVREAAEKECQKQ
jgi:hypothetical protein